MTDEEINLLIEIKFDMERSVSQAVREVFQKMDELIHSKYKENAKHRHFKTKKEMKRAMIFDRNPWNTFSFGKKNPRALVVMITVIIMISLQANI